LTKTVYYLVYDTHQDVFCTNRTGLYCLRRIPSIGRQLLSGPFLLLLFFFGMWLPVNG